MVNLMWQERKELMKKHREVIFTLLQIHLQCLIQCLIQFQCFISMLYPMLDPVSMLDPISFPMLDLIQKFFYCVFVMLFSITISQRLVRHVWIQYTFKEGQVDTLLEIAFYLCYKETILIFQTCNIDIAQACNAASAMSSDS